jgi:hypothetical protein
MEKTKFELTKENYFSHDADLHYMSNSQFKNFCECEARAFAEIMGHWKRPDSKTFLLGQCAHAWNEGVLDDWIDDHYEQLMNVGLLTKTGSYNANMKLLINKHIPIMEGDKAIMTSLEGSKEVIMTFEFGGVSWKMMIDSYNPEKGRFSDFKYMANIDSQWHPKYGKRTFVEHYGYDTQMSLYRYGERQYTGRENYLEPFITGLTKQEVPKRIIIKGFDDNLMKEKLFGDDGVRYRLERVLDVKHGGAIPINCAECEYCRVNEKTQIIPWYELPG